jgi:hypothetical protein
VEPNSFFSDLDPQFFFSDSAFIFWPKNFKNGASHCFHMCSGICTTEEKVFQLKNLRFFLFQVFDLRFFKNFFILQQCLDPNPNPNPNIFSDSDWDPAKIFGFFRSRIHNTVLEPGGGGVGV